MSDHQPEAAPLSAPPSERSALVLAELERILASAAFRNARRSQELLRYIVTHGLEGSGERLKERTIGAEVFQRQADYDTGEDSIVRVKASELRRRLAQFYHEAPDSGVQIELPLGSYVPEFHIHASAALPVEPAAAGRRPFWLWPALGAAVLVLAFVAWWFGRPRPAESALNAFWEPVFRSPAPVLLCAAHPEVFYLRPGTRALLDRTPPPDSIPIGEVHRDSAHSIGQGDAFTLAQLTGYLRVKGKTVQLRAGNDVAFAELRNSPAVLIGAFTNQWTMQMTSNLRYVFDKKDGRSAIRDQMNPDQAWHYPPTGTGDYVLISRIYDSRSGNVVITAAGIGDLGTQMAGEFLTNPIYMQQLVRSAPADWSQRNLQIVLAGELIGRTVGPPKVVASWYW
jgi:hypothetical protein